MSLNIHVSYDTPAACTLELRGRLDTNSAPSLKSLLDDIVDGQFQVLVYDLGGLEYISDDAMNVLFKGSLQVQARGGKASLMRLQPQVLEKFRGLKTMPDMPLFHDEADLHEYLAMLKQRGGTRRGH